MPFTTHLENGLLDHAFGAVAYNPPANLYIALFSAAPTQAGGGTELEGGDYERIEVPNNKQNFTNADNSALTTGNNHDFGPGLPPGTIMAVGFYDAAVGGNLIGFDAREEVQRTVTNADIYRVPAGQVNIRFVQPA